MLLARYINIEHIYAKEIDNENELISKINDTLKEETETEITSKLDSSALNKASFYYNFASYSLLARSNICNMCNIIKF